MEITEKLNIFYTSALDVANKESSDIMLEYAESMERVMEEFKNNKDAEIDSRYHMEEAKLIRDENRKVSEAATEQKRKLNLYQQQKKQALFEIVEQRLKDYQNTESYEQYLIGKIRMAKEFAREEEIIIYLNPTDAFRKDALEKETGCCLTISTMDFDGGIRAVIRSRNVLIDESFQTKLNQEREAYTF